MRVAVVGAGQIAEAHLEEIVKIPGVRLAGLCDLMTTPLEALSDKFPIEKTFTDFNLLLRDAKPDVVHITTPPASHFPLAMQAIRNGAHVYMEKPFTVTLEEAEELLHEAEKSARLVCSGTNRIKSLETLKAFSIISDKELFGEMVHMDSVFGYNLEGIFGKLLLSNPDHWIAALPGQLFQNNLSHPLSLIVPFLSDSLEIDAKAFDLTDNGIINDELRLQIFDKEKKLTTSILFTSSSRPVSFYARYFGTKQTIYLNLTEHFFMSEKSAALPGGLGLSLSLRGKASLLRSQFRRNFLNFWTGKETYFSDMGRLFTDFYTAIAEKTPPPVPYDQILRTSKIMEVAFSQISPPLAGTPE